MSQCKNCGEEVKLFDAVTVSGPWLIWECPKCHSDNFEKSNSNHVYSKKKNK